MGGLDSGHRLEIEFGAGCSHKRRTVGVQGRGSVTTELSQVTEDLAGCQQGQPTHSLTGLWRLTDDLAGCKWRRSTEQQR